jgi:hypothetical protein
MNSFADDRRFLKVAKSLKSVKAVAKGVGPKALIRCQNDAAVRCFPETGCA